MATEIDSHIEKIVACLKKSSKIDVKVWEVVRSSKEALAAFEQFLKTADSVVIGREATVTFQNGTTIDVTDSNPLNTKDVYQWICSGIKTVEFVSNARSSQFVQAIMDLGNPRNIKIGVQGVDDGDIHHYPMLGPDVVVRSMNNKKSSAALIAKPLLIRCFNSISSLECSAADVLQFDFQGEIMVLDSLKVLAEDQNQIMNVLKKKNIKATKIEVHLTTLKSKAYGAEEMSWRNLVASFSGIKNPRLEAVESFKLIIDRIELIGPLALQKLAEKCQEAFPNLKAFEVFREFVGFKSEEDENTKLPVPKTHPKLYLELKNQIMAIDPALKVDVGWNVLEYYDSKIFKSAVAAYRKILTDFEEDPESEMNIMMSKKEKLSESKTLYTEFYIMFDMEMNF